ncbi:excisionase family DNA-binding protein [Demequina capsici]|uniref:Excisionase family DNA-binding protein n=1 Tax=Demequina capsici TaxID=3075620 RepID=A0AA96F5Z3_9MICO|nr:excisionase family DNA-binding protein [Demequina sp. OYTSA14]WNM24307.1 excisionase family DNA-binding protein [Demequina sp. OYTSA14]
MTMTLRAADGRAEIAVTDDESKAAALALKNIPTAAAAEALVEISVPRELVDLVHMVLHAASRGEQLTIGSMPDELSTSVAADQLGISRPTLMKLIENGELDAHKVGTHTRIKTEDVRVFRRARLERQRRAFDELRELEEGLGS